MRLSGLATSGVSALLGILTLSMLVGCDFNAPSANATILPSRYATQQLAALSQEDEAIITRSIENRHPSSVDNYYMVKSVSAEGPTSAGTGLSFVANVDWAGFGPVTARYFTVRGVFDPRTRRVMTLGPLVPREAPSES